MTTAVVLFAVFVMTLGNMTVHATLGLFSRSIGLGEFQAGMVIASSGLLFALTASRWGRFADERGRRPVILSGLAGGAVSLLLFGLLFTLKAGEVGVVLAFSGLLGARIVYGLLCAGLQPAAVAHMADVTSAHDRSAGAAMVGAALGLATLVGPMLVVAMVGLGFAAAPLIACALTVLAIPVVAAVLRDRPRAPPSLAPTRPTTASAREGADGGEGRIRRYLVLTFIFNLAFAGLQATNAFFVQDTLRIDTVEAVQRASLVSLAFAASSFGVQAFVVRALGWSADRLLAVGLAVCGVACSACLAAPGFAWLTAAFAAMGVGFAGVQSGLTAGASLAGRGDRQGQIAGRLLAATSAAWIVGPLMGTALYEATLAGPLIVTAVAMAVALLIHRLR
ncbi:MAG: MFS transporter [Reyranella sp.]|uniref:MFS transporter n=1 Tax=Reyranella sp. TaxID=1929291 RepID=UPI0025F92304|nr:MFS transporter [Reyranella sp.]MBR2820112.1 MFS transporter [Reyranella sp.]